MKGREEGAGSSGLSNGGDACFLEGIASSPVGNPYNKNVNCPVLHQSVNSILSSLEIKSIFSISDKFDA